jgi:hypothetical protein
MFKPGETTQTEFEIVSINELVPDDHLLGLDVTYIDFHLFLTGFDQIKVMIRAVHPYCYLSKYKKIATHLERLEKRVAI